MLDEERQHYDRFSAEWAAAHAGQIVVIKGVEVVDFFDTFDEALAAGVAKWSGAVSRAGCRANRRSCDHTGPGAGPVTGGPR